jgi:hypothetical protein
VQAGTRAAGIFPHQAEVTVADIVAHGVEARGARARAVDERRRPRRRARRGALARREPSCAPKHSRWPGSPPASSVAEDPRLEDRRPTWCRRAARRSGAGGARSPPLARGRGGRARRTDPPCVSRGRLGADCRPASCRWRRARGGRREAGSRGRSIPATRPC